MRAGAESMRKRAAILDAVRQDPGIHVAELARRVGLPWRTTSFHLAALERQGALVSYRRDRERHLFPAGVPDLHRDWLAALRSDNAQEVLHLLSDCPWQSIPQISRRTGFSQKVVRRQIANLVEAGLVQRRGTLRPEYDPIVGEAELARWLDRAGADGRAPGRAAGLRP